MPTPLGFVFGLGLPLLLLRFPVTGIVLVAIVGQEIAPNGRYGVLTTLGNDLYLGHGKIPIIVALALVAASAAIAQAWPLKGITVRSLDAVVFASATGLVILATGSGLINGQSIFSAVNQNARPFVLLLLGLIIGVSLRWSPAESKRLIVAASVTLVGLVAAAAIAIPLGGSADIRVSRYFVYYDAALPAIAAAVFVAVLVSTSWRWDWWHLAVAVSLPLLVLMSFRRSVWIASSFALIVAAVLSWPRLRHIVGRFTYAGLVTVLVVLASPGFAADLGLRSGVSLHASDSPPMVDSQPRPPSSNPSISAPADTPKTPGTANPEAKPTAKPSEVDSAELTAASTNSHIEDLRIGWRHAVDNFWTGIGPSAPQLPGLAAQKASRVYVHNELLQTWLRYGPLAPLLMISLLVAAGVMAIRVLRDRQSNVIARAAAGFCLIAPPCLMTAPFLSGTSRWPLLMGVAAGILALQGGSETSSLRPADRTPPTHEVSS